MFNNIFKIEISANVVAWYGAIIATFSIILAFLNYFRDRTKIKVKISQGFFTYGNNLGKEVNIFIEAMNVGRHPVTLTGAGLTLKNGKQMFVIRPELISFPYELQEGKSVQVSLDRNETFQEAEKENSKISYAWYRVATDKVYKAKFRMKNK